MKDNMKDLYKGINPIYESMMASVKEDKEKGTDKKGVSTDAVSLLSLAINTFFEILLNSKMENAKTVRGFQEIKNKILGINNFGAFRQYLISMVESLSKLDLSQKEAYSENIKYITDLLAKAEPSLSDPKIFDALKKDKISKILSNFESDLKVRQDQMQKTNPKLFGEVVKQGLVVKEAKKTGEESKSEEGEYRSRAFNKSKETLDSALSFAGMIRNDKLIAVLKNNEEVKKYETKAEELLKQAEDLHITGRGGVFGGKVETPSGSYKSGEYKRKQDDLINEIIRYKEEYVKLKQALLKQGGLNLPPAPVIPVMPPVYNQEEKDKTSGGGGTQGGEPEPKPKKETKVCEFPVQLNTKCYEVGKIQKKLMEIIPAINDYLSTKGKADKIYGKATAAVCNIVWGYLSGNIGQELTSPLTEDMYNQIMGLTANDIDTTTTAIVGAAIKDNKNWEMSISQKIQEREEIKGAPILSFEDFYSVIEESYSFQKMDEDGEPKSIGDAGPWQPGSAKKLKDSCIKDSIAQGKVLPCVASGGGGTDTDKKKEDEKKKEAPKWKGLKPVKDNIYTISYDESALSAIGKSAIGAAVGVAVIASGGAALAAYGPVGLVSAAGLETAAGAGVSAAYAGASANAAMLASLSAGAGSALSSPVAVGAGVIGGAGAAEAMSGRTNVAVTVVNGFITRGSIIRIVRGLINTLDGRVSDDDLQAIMSSLAVLKGAWTCNSEETKAISAWAEVKRLYNKKENEVLKNVILGGGEESRIGTFTVSTVENFPEFSSRTLSEGDDTDAEDAMDQIEEAINRLDNNEDTLAKNLESITPEIIEALIDGSVMVEKDEIETNKSEESEGSEESED
jgi:hypothetical protein